MNRKSYLIAGIVLVAGIMASEAQARGGALAGRAGVSLVIGGGKVHSRLSIVAPIRSSYGNGHGYGHGRPVGHGHGVVRRPSVAYRPAVVHHPVVVRRPAVVHCPPVVHRPAVVHAPVIPAPTVVVERPVVVQVQPTTITVWITNSNGSKSSVVLIQEGTWYIGPRGERYYGMPTENQLRMVYGL